MFDDEIMAKLIWAVIGGFALLALGRWLKGKIDALTAGGTAAPPDLTGVVQLVLTVVLWALVAWVVVLALRWWTGRRRRVRDFQREALLEDLSSAIALDLKTVRMGWRGRWLWWRRQRVNRVRFRLAPAAASLGPGGREAVLDAARRHLGPVRPPRWPEPHEVPWVRIVAGEDVPANETQGEEDKRVDVLTRSLDGLVPSPKVAPREGGWEISYGETTRDQSANWRARVVDQVEGRMGGTYRPSWDRQARRLTLEPVPELPHPLLWEAEHARWSSGLGTMVLPYGTDENGHLVAWDMGDRRPHAMCVGATGSGKTETMKAIIASALWRGALVAIIDPKAKDFQEFLGKPGVIAVATAIEDRGHMLMAMLAEVKRRNSALALRRLRKQHDSLAQMVLPEQSAIDEVPILFVVDEVTQMTDDFQKWWAGLSKEDQQEWGGASKLCPLLDIAPQIAQLSRACRIHLLLGMQRADARNFGPNTAMRDNVTHLVTMATQTPIGSEMVWGDRSTGVNVEIRSVGEGLSNAMRYASGGHELGGGRPGRFKAWWLKDTAEQQAFWAYIDKIAPDASLIDLPGVSAAASSPEAAMEALLAQAYGTSWRHQVRQGDVPSPLEAQELPSDSPATPAADTAGITPPPVAEVPPTPPGPPAAEDGDEQDEEIELDAAGVSWAHVAVDVLEAGDRVMLVDGDEVEVREVEGLVVDEDFGDEVFRVVVVEDGREKVVDLSPDEMVSRATV